MRRVWLLGFACWAGVASAEVGVPDATSVRNKPGLPAIQRDFGKLKRAATFPVARKDADWVAIDRDAVWVAGKGPDLVKRIDPARNAETLSVPLPGAACAGLAAGFGSVWVPICGDKTLFVLRIDAVTGKTVATIPMGPPAEAGIAAGGEAIWFVVDGRTLVAIDPATNGVAKRVALAEGSAVPEVDGDMVWVTSPTGNLVSIVDARLGEVVGTVATGPSPRFLAAGGGAIWTMNQGDGSLTRIDAASRRVTATIPLGLPGSGGDIAFGDGKVWVTEVGVPLTAIDARDNRPLVQWKGPGGDSLRFGHGSVWLTDYLAGSLLRIAPERAVR